MRKTSLIKFLNNLKFTISYDICSTKLLEMIFKIIICINIYKTILKRFYFYSVK